MPTTSLYVPLLARRVTFLLVRERTAVDRYRKREELRETYHNMRALLVERCQRTKVLIG